MLTTTNINIHQITGIIFLSIESATAKYFGGKQATESLLKLFPIHLENY